MLCYIQLCNRESVNVNGNSAIRSYISLRVSISFFLVFYLGLLGNDEGR